MTVMRIAVESIVSVPGRRDDRDSAGHHGTHDLGGPGHRNRYAVVDGKKESVSWRVDHNGQPTTRLTPATEDNAACGRKTLLKRDRTPR
jgi:hypothetical protein